MTLMATRTPTHAEQPTVPAAGRTAAPRALSGRLLTALVRGVLGLALVGAVLAGLQLRGEPGEVAASPAPLGLVTSYGRVTVGDVTVSAVAAGADKGMVGKGGPAAGHAGHAAPAADAKATVNVPVTLQNDSDAAVAYSPAQFRLDVGTGAPVAPQDAALLTGSLRPEAAVALRLTFAVPTGATGARLLVDGATPSAGVDLALPAAGAPAQQMTPQDQAQQGRPAAEQREPAGAPSADHGRH